MVEQVAVNQKVDGSIPSLPSLIGFVFYDLLAEVFFNGQSFGKRILKIRVVSIDGSRPSFSQYLLRWLFRIVDFTVSSGVCAVICVAVSDKSQRIGDMVAGTVVIKTVPRTSINQTIYTPTPDLNYTISFPEVSNLTDKDMQLVKDVRDFFLETGNIDALAKLAIKIKTKTGIVTEMKDGEFIATLLKDYNHHQLEK